MKDLKEKKERLLKLREERKEAYRGISNYQKNLQTAVQNVEAIIDPDTSSQRQIQREGTRLRVHRQEVPL